MSELLVARADHVDETLRAQLFPHEHDLIGNLRRFPLVVRYRLDVMQLRMSLDTWQRLSYEDRLKLAIAPFSNDVERQALASDLQDRVRKAQGVALEVAPPESMADFRQVERVPEEIESALAHFRLSVTADQWRELDELARFGLAKLSRHGHDNKRLGPLIDDILYTPSGGLA